MGGVFSSSRYSAVASTVALALALGGGTAYAAQLITSKDIEDGGVRRADLAKGAVDSCTVADGSLKSRDFGAGQLPGGTQGPAGPAGASGDLDLLYVRTGPLNADVGVYSGVVLAGYAVCGSATTVDQEYVVVTPGRTTMTETTADGVRIIARPG